MTDKNHLKYVPRLTVKATKETARELRIRAMEEIDALPVETKQDEMLKRMYD